MEHPAAGPRLIHLDVHEAALGHTHLDLRYLLLGADDDPQPPAGESPDGALVQLGRGHGPGRPRRCSTRSPSPEPCLRGSSVTDDLDHLLAVQDLDTSITQLQHRRDALVETSGLAAVEAELAGLRRERADGGGAAGRAGGDPEGARGADRRHHRAPDAIEQRMYAATSSSGRDLQAMNDEVRHLAERRAELEELELVAMLDQDPVDAELAALRERGAPLEAQRRRAAGAGGREPARDRRRAGRGRRVPRRPRPPFSRPRCPTATRRCGRASRAPVRARLVGNRCDGCHLELSSVEVEKIRALPAGRDRHLRAVRADPRPRLSARALPC